MEHDDVTSYIKEVLVAGIVGGNEPIGATAALCLRYYQQLLMGLVEWNLVDRFCKL